jgi:hypothetical protein
MVPDYWTSSVFVKANRRICVKCEIIEERFIDIEMLNLFACMRGRVLFVFCCEIRWNWGKEE